MDPTDGKASDFERRTSMRRSVRLSQHAGDDDDCDVLAMGVADGFRPTMMDGPATTTTTPTTGPSPSADAAPVAAAAATPLSHQHTSSSQSSSSLQPPTPRSRVGGPSRPTTPPVRPSSVAKPRPSHDSFALQHDGPRSSSESERHHQLHQHHNHHPPHSAVPSGASASATDVASSARSVLSGVSSTTLDSPVLRVESPYSGPSGPSFPYQMYPQNVRLARTASLATTSTAAAPASERSYAGPHTPAHPYGMYPQNIGADDAPIMAPEPAPPVGFPGLAAGPYQRRLGPDGEDVADMIGPDGHTEELPPYSRYPDETYARKVRDIEHGGTTPPQQPQQQQQLQDQAADQPSGSVIGASIQAAATADPAPPPPRRIPGGAGGIGLATLNPEFGSTDDLGSPTSRHSSRSFTSDGSQHEINAVARGGLGGGADVSEKDGRRRSGPWKHRASRKVCGVPAWGICCLAFFVVVLGVVLGTVVGTFLAKSKKPFRPEYDDR